MVRLVPSQEGIDTQDDVVDYLHAMYEYYTDQSTDAVGINDIYAKETDNDAKNILRGIADVTDEDMAQAFVRKFSMGSRVSRRVSSELIRHYVTKRVVSESVAVEHWQTLFNDDDPRVAAYAYRDSQRYANFIAASPLSRNELGQRRVERLRRQLGHYTLRPVCQ